MNRPILLLDSGVGGLTVLQNLLQLLPNENYIYLADNGFFPYGTKTYIQLENRLQKLAQYLSTLNIKAIVIACNTASLHLKSMQKLLKIPVIDVILPTCKKAVQLTQNKKVCLLATNATVQSGIYQNILQKNGVDILPVACSDFVPLVESGMSNSRYAREIVAGKLKSIAKSDFDTVILGCTHFGFLQNAISNVFDNRNYLQCGMPTAFYLKKILQKANLLCNQMCGNIKLFSTGKIDAICRMVLQLNLQVSNAQVVHLPQD